MRHIRLAAAPRAGLGTLTDVPSPALRAAAKRVWWAVVLACAAAGPLSPTSSADDVLAAMHDRGADLRSFTAEVTQVQDNANFATTDTYRGHVTFQALARGDARLHLTLNTKQKMTGPLVPSKREYLLVGGVVTDRDYSLKVENQRQLAPAGQKVNLMQLGGPLPLPIGQDPAGVKRLFDVTRTPLVKGDPPNTVHLTLTPKPGTGYAQQFSEVSFWVDPVQRMPVQVQTVDVKGVNTQTNLLTHLVVNPAVGEADFTLAPVTGWRVSEVPAGR